MIKISKNIKKFRKVNNMTQEQLAEKMNLTRQAISNWENDKAQPDINGITKLAEIFNVSIEEMVYGSTKKVGYEENTDNKVSIIKVVLSVIGGLFFSAGLIVLFIAFWQDFSDFFKTLLSTVPFLVAFGFAAFVYTKKKDITVLREIAGVVWCAGVFSSLKMIESCYFNNFDSRGIILLLTCLLIIPIMFILKSISVLPVYYIFHAIFSFSFYPLGGYPQKYDFDISLLLILPLFMVGAVFTYMQKRDSNEIRFKICMWLSAVSFASSCGAVFLREMDFIVAICIIILFFSYCLISEKQGFYILPFRIIGVLGICIDSLLLATQVDGYLDSFDLKKDIGFDGLFVIAVALAVFIFSIVFVREDFEFNVSNVVLCISTGVSLFLFIIFNFNEVADWDIKEAALLLSGSAVGLSQILKGVDKLSLFELNVGITSVFVAIGILTSVFFDFSLFSIGGLLIIFGLAMFFANWLVSKKKNAKIQSNS